jgi:hypothetical protein
MPLIRPLILLTLLCVCAQTRINAQRNAIDSLQTPAQIETFLRRFDDGTKVVLSTTKLPIGCLDNASIRRFGAVTDLATLRYPANRLRL